jgi:hypothetical protein
MHLFRFLDTRSIINVRNARRLAATSRFICAQRFARNPAIGIAYLRIICHFEVLRTRVVIPLEAETVLF